MTVQLENKITLGNVLTILAMLAAVITGYANLKAEQTRLGEKLGSIEQAELGRAAAYDGRHTNHEGRIRAVEIAQASQSSDLRNIQIGINEIKGALDRLQPGK